jgi:hypothetical protein
VTVDDSKEKTKESSKNKAIVLVGVFATFLVFMEMIVMQAKYSFGHIDSNVEKKSKKQDQELLLCLS